MIALNWLLLLLFRRLWHRAISVGFWFLAAAAFLVIFLRLNYLREKQVSIIMFSGAETDDFLATMTFAAGDLLGMGCECDECECEAPGDAVPPTIRNAVDEHLKKRQLEHPSVFEGSKRLCIRQSREMVKREDGFSIWKLDLPLDGGDPIVEYRNSHRVVFVKQLRKVSMK